MKMPHVRDMVSVNIKLRGITEMTLRIRVASWLIRLAAWLMGGKGSVELNTPGQ